MHNAHKVVTIAKVGVNVIRILIKVKFRAIFNIFQVNFDIIISIRRTLLMIKSINSNEYKLLPMWIWDILSNNESMGIYPTECISSCTTIPWNTHPPSVAVWICKFSTWPPSFMPTAELQPEPSDLIATQYLSPFLYLRKRMHVFWWNSCIAPLITARISESVIVPN